VVSGADFLWTGDEYGEGVVFEVGGEDPYFETMVFSMVANSSLREVQGVRFPLAPLVPLEVALPLGLALDLARGSGSSSEEEDSESCSNSLSSSASKLESESSSLGRRVGFFLALRDLLDFGVSSSSLFSFSSISTSSV